MPRGLTDRQQDVLQWICDYIQEEGYPPSIREIGDAFRIGSLRGVTVHLDALSRKGFIERSKRPRSIRILHSDYRSDRQTRMLDLLGDIAAGQPIYASGNVEEQLPVPAAMIRDTEEAFLLRVRGESMTGDGIMPNDIVVIKKQDHANTNELVAVLINEDASVKRLQIDGAGMRLLSSNSDYEPIVVEDPERAKIMGLVVGVLRDYRRGAF